MAEVHQKYGFIDSPDPFWDGHAYIGESTDEIGFFEYANQLKTTEGFHVDRVPEIFWTSIVPENVDSEYTIEAANKAVKEFNRLKGADLKLSKILNANCLIISSALYFLTLQCSNDLFYEAKIDMFIGEGCKLVMFRRAKYWPRREDKNTNEEGGVEGSQIIGKKRRTCSDSLSKPTAITMSKSLFSVSKLLTKSDITTRLAIPTKILPHMMIPLGECVLDLPVMYSREEVWRFQLYTRPYGSPNPAFTRGWIKFVREKNLKIGDRLTFDIHQDGELHIQVTKLSDVTYEGKPDFLDPDPDPEDPSHL